MRPQRIGLIALLTVLATLAIDNFQLIQNPKSKIQNSQVLAQTPDARKAEADRLLQQGLQQYDTRQYTDAIKSWEGALQIYRKNEDWQNEGGVLRNLRLVHSNLGNYVKAVEYAHQSLAIARKLKDQKSEYEALLSLGYVYDVMRDFPKAIEFYRQSLAIAQQLKNHLGEGSALKSLVVAYKRLGDAVKVTEYLKQYLTIAHELKDRKEESWSLNELSIAYSSLGDNLKAIDYAKQNLALARELKDQENESDALLNLGDRYIRSRDYPKAFEYFYQSLAISQELKDRQAEINVLNHMGDTFSELGDYANELEYYKQSLAITQKLKNRDKELTALNNLGVAYGNLGDYATAIEYFKQGLTIAQELKDPNRELTQLNNLDVAYTELRDFPKAIEYSKQHLAIAMQQYKNHKGDIVAMYILGNAYNSLRNFPKAIEYYKQALAILQEREDSVGKHQLLSAIADAYVGMDDFAKAVEYYQQSLSITREWQDHLEEANVLGDLGRVYKYLGDYVKAIDCYKQILPITREFKQPLGEGRTLSNLGDALFQSGKLTEAEPLLVAAIQIYESLRQGLSNNNKISIADTQDYPYKKLQQVWIAQNKGEAALEISERGRARAFLEQLAKRVQATERPTIAPIQIAAIQQVAREQNATLVEYSIIDDDFKIKGTEERHESELYIWVIKPTGEITFRKADLKPLWQKQDTTLADLVYSSRDSISVRGLPIIGIVPRPGAQQRQEASLTEQLQQLHQLLIEPIADLLPTDPNAHVVFIPQGSLFLVPFPALKDKDGKYLIEKHTILTAPSIQVLQLTHQQRQKRGSREWGVGRSFSEDGDVLVVGNPTMPSVPPAPGQPAQQLPSLPGAETEANAIAPLLNTKPLIGNLATKSAILQLLPKARIIHLATHGLLDDVRGLGSAIALAPDPSSSYKEKIGEVNGLLTAEEILDLKLNANLVVLSACNTGRGRITGDGVIGLSRSLISAGVPSVMVSLWSVPDAPTASLMTEFYRNLQQNPDKAQALRSAMLTIMKQRPEPKNWAAFTLIGEAE